MKDTLSEHDSAPVSIHELLDIRKTPGLAYQSYEAFKSDALSRTAAQQAFMRGESDEILLQYVNLPTQESLAPAIAQLDVIIERIDSGEIADELEAAITRSTVEFRRAEMQFTLLATHLHELTAEYNVQKNANTNLNKLQALENEIATVATEYRRQNALLYGEPTQQVYDEVRGEIWHGINAKKNLGPIAQHLINDLTHGFVHEGGTVVKPLEKSSSRPPKLTSEAATFIGDYIEEEYATYRAIVQEYYDDVVLPRAEQEGKEPEFTGDDFVVLFDRSLSLLDPNNTAGIKINPVPDSMGLAWDTPSMSVNVGLAPRADVVRTVEKAFGKVIHELPKGHGGRTVRGLSTRAAVLGYGVFSEFDPAKGESPDYLSFEEGWNLLAESIVRGDAASEDDQWKLSDTRHYLHIAMALLDDRSTRELYEISWRVTALENLKDGDDLTEEAIVQAQQTAARSIERFERSRPAGLPESAGKIVFSKDLAYTPGKRKAILVGNDLAKRGDLVSLRNTDATKTDPTNQLQNTIAARAGHPVQLSEDFTLIA